MKGMDKMIKGAVFDLDHTLFDRYATQRLCMNGFCVADDRIMK